MCTAVPCAITSPPEQPRRALAACLSVTQGSDSVNGCPSRRTRRKGWPGMLPSDAGRARRPALPQNRRSRSRSRSRSRTLPPHPGLAVENVENVDLTVPGGGPASGGLGRLRAEGPRHRAGVRLMAASAASPHRVHGHRSVVESAQQSERLPRLGQSLVMPPSQFGRPGAVHVNTARPRAPRTRGLHASVSWCRVFRRHAGSKPAGCQLSHQSSLENFFLRMSLTCLSDISPATFRRAPLICSGLSVFSFSTLW